MAGIDGIPGLLTVWIELAAESQPIHQEK